MKTILYILILFVLALMIDATASMAQRNDPCSDDPTELAIRALVTRFQTAILTHDAKSFAACFTADAEVTSSNGQVIHGPVTIQDVVGPGWTKPSATIKQVWQNPFVRFLKPDIVIVALGTERITSSRRPATSDSSESYLLSWIVSREGNGQWLIKISHATHLFQKDVTPARH